MGKNLEETCHLSLRNEIFQNKRTGVAIDGAAKRLMKSIHIAFGHSRRSR